MDKIAAPRIKRDTLQKDFLAEGLLYLADRLIYLTEGLLYLTEGLLCLEKELLYLAEGLSYRRTLYLAEGWPENGHPIEVLLLGLETPGDPEVLLSV